MQARRPDSSRSSLRLLAAVALGTALSLPAQTVPPRDVTDPDVVRLDKLTVAGARAEGYGAVTAPTTSKLNIALIENPLNIQVVSRSLMDDQGALKLDDVLRNVAGVMPGGYYDNWDYYRIRGFAADFNVFIDGLRGGNGMGEETFGIEQAEIVKGPASSLFGQGPVGGVVNLVSKRPRAERFAKTELSFGSDDYRSASLDFNAPLGSGDHLLFRLPVLLEDQDSFTDFANNETLYVAPALTWKFGADTSVTFLGKYKETDAVHAMPLPAIGTLLPNPNGPIPLDRYVGEPGSNRAYEDSGHIGYELTHRFNDSLTLRQNARYDRYVQGWRDMLYPSYLAEDQRTLYRYPYNYWQDWHDFAVDTRLEATFAHGSLKHQFLVGLDQYRKSYRARSQTIDFNDPAGNIGLDLYNPVYGTPIPAYQPITPEKTKTLNTGVYVHDHVKLPHNVSVTLGGRFDWAKAGTVKAEEFTPKVGATWQFRSDAALYANFSESFEPPTWQTRADGKPVDPETGTNWEVGVKKAAADGRLTATLALYELTRQNVATADLTNPGYFLVTGEQRSRGIELDGRFNPLPGWDLTAAYAYTDARITADNSLPVGARTNGVPYHSVNLWTKYSFQQGPLEGFGAGAGFRYYSSQSGDETYVTYFEIPSYALFEFALYYRRDRFSAQLNLTNAFDREYYSGAYDALYVLPGEPRSLRATVGWSF